MADESDGNKLRIIEDVGTGNRFVTYDTKGGTAIEVLLVGDSPWFTQKDMSSIYGVSISDVSRHIKRYSEDGELDDSAIAEFAITATDGKSYPTKHYGMDVAFYVGFRVNSTEGKQFRKWGIGVLLQVATKGFYIDRRKVAGDISRLRQIRQIIADIRSDEATMYAELRSIFSTCKDYDPQSETSHEFFAHFQNCMLYAITGYTAAELIRSRAKSSIDNMGLTAWHGDQIIQSDVTTAKNYLGELELKDLNRLVDLVLGFFEDQVERGWIATMEQAMAGLAEILKVARRKMLQGYGSTKKSTADNHAKAEYKKFKVIRAESEFRALAAVKAEVKSLPKRRRGSKLSS